MWTVESGARELYSPVVTGGCLRKMAITADSRIWLSPTGRWMPTTGGCRFQRSYKFTNGHISINSDQHFGGVSDISWNAWIGGYRPAQKWLKDRKRQRLSGDDIDHYQRMLEALRLSEITIEEFGRISARQQE